VGKHDYKKEFVVVKGEDGKGRLENWQERESEPRRKNGGGKGSTRGGSGKNQVKKKWHPYKKIVFLSWQGEALLRRRGRSGRSKRRESTCRRGSRQQTSTPLEVVKE